MDSRHYLHGEIIKKMGWQKGRLGIFRGQSVKNAQAFSCVDGKFLELRKL
jgi:hypothetical protein